MARVLIQPKRMNGSLRVRTVTELLSSPPPPPSSVDRFLGLPDGVWTPEVFQRAAQSFLRETGFLRAFVLDGNRALPGLASDVSYKYRPEFEQVGKRASEGEMLLVALVMEKERVVA